MLLQVRQVVTQVSKVSSVSCRGAMANRLRETYTGSSQLSCGRARYDQLVKDFVRRFEVKKRRGARAGREGRADPQERVQRDVRHPMVPAS